MAKSNYVVWHEGHLTKEDRNRLNQHASGVIWFTGLPASGKSTIAHALEKELYYKGIRAYVLDGDNIRHGLNADLGFSREDRDENIKRIVEVAKLFVDAGIVVLAAFITPFNGQRQFIKNQFKGISFIEVYTKCDIEECIRRDPKGLYKKAQIGVIKDYTGITSPYEEPGNPELIIDTQKLSVEESVSIMIDYMQNMDFLTF